MKFNIFNVENSRVRIFDNRVEKYTYTPSELARKYAAIQTIGRDFGFIAPKVLDIKKDRIILERLHGIRSLQKVYLDGDIAKLTIYIRHAGKVLGQIHSQLNSNRSAFWKPEETFIRDIFQYYGSIPYFQSLKHASLHCDYSFANVFVDSSSEELIVIDPCPNFASTHQIWTQGPIYLDIGKMLSCLEGQIPPWHLYRRLSSYDTVKLQHAFLDAYSETASAPDVAVAHAFAYATAASQFRRRFGYLGVVHRTALYNQLVGNFPLRIKLSSWPRITI
jgi:hypothetical protein